jgi:hypothetical protein
MSDALAERICVHGDCQVTIGLKRSKNHNLFCASHLPERRAKAHENAVRRGRKSGEARRAKSDHLFSYVTEPNRDSALIGILQLGNFLSQGVSRRDWRRHRLITKLLVWLYERLPDAGDAMKLGKVTEIVCSTLPSEVKLTSIMAVLGLVNISAAERESDRSEVHPSPPRAPDPIAPA